MRAGSTNPRHDHTFEDINEGSKIEKSGDDKCWTAMVVVSGRCVEEESAGGCCT